MVGPCTGGAQALARDDSSNFTPGPCGDRAQVGRRDESDDYGGREEGSEILGSEDIVLNISRSAAE
jgi:hypothetical protein